MINDPSHEYATLFPVPSRWAFTLIELLVVIAIIAILAAIIVPAVTGALQKSREIHCVSNLRQISLAFRTYSLDHEDGVGVDGNLWMESLGDSYGDAIDLLWCPTTSKPDDPLGTSRIGDVKTPWVRGASGTNPAFVGSYGINNWLYNPRQVPSGWSQFDPALAFASDVTLDNPSTTPAFMDCIRWGASPRASDRPAPNLFSGASKPGMARILIARHGKPGAASAPRRHPPAQPLPGAINMSFADGHGQIVPLEELWFKTWHQKYLVPSSRPR